jgi:hypothetical protein
MSIFLCYYLGKEKQQNSHKKLPSLDEVKNKYVAYLLDVTGNDIEEAAEILDVPPIFLQKRIKT